MPHREPSFYNDAVSSLVRTINKMAENAEKGSVEHLRGLELAWTKLYPLALQEREASQGVDWSVIQFQARHSLQLYTQIAEHSYIVARFHQHLFSRIQEAVEKDAGRIYVGMPVRHGKSEICSVHLPAWYIGNNPDKNVMLICATQELANNFSRRVRDFISESHIYRTLFPQVKPSNTRWAANEWRTTEGGGLKAIGAGGNVSGFGADLLIIDDPHQDDDWLVERQLQNVFDWYVSAARRRCQPGCSIVLLMTRWHERDLAGRLIELPTIPGSEDADVFDQCLLQAIAGPDDPIGRAEGEYLWPEHYTEEEYKRQRAASEERWQAMYQQNPQAFSDRLFREGNIKWLDKAPPEGGKYFWTADFAVSMSARADYNVIAYWQWHDGALTLLDFRRYRGDANTSVEVLAALLEKYEKMQIWIPNDTVELALVPVFRDRFRDIRWPEIKTGQMDKREKAQAAAALFEEGRIQFIKGMPGVDRFVHEVMRFPNYDHDDCVDVLSLAAMKARMKYDIQPPSS